MCTTEVGRVCCVEPWHVTPTILAKVDDLAIQQPFAVIVIVVKVAGVVLHHILFSDFVFKVA